MTIQLPEFAIKVKWRDRGEYYQKLIVCHNCQEQKYFYILKGLLVENVAKNIKCNICHCAMYP